MVEIDAKTVMALRKKTGAPMMDCKAALIEAAGNEEKATEILRKKGLQADARGGRDATEGQVFSYVHHNGKLGVLVEVCCETDFVARNEEFQDFGRTACLHVAAMRPAYLAQEDVDAAAIEKERKFLVEQASEQMAGRPDEVVQKAVDGRMQKFFAEKCMLEQVWVKDEGSKKTVAEVQKELAGKIGENIRIRRFALVELGA
jgi:elongation factor Ts